METQYPKLARPKRKLCYLTNSDSLPKKWAGTLNLEDVDKIFDDVASPSTCDDELHPSSTLLQTLDESNQCEKVDSPVPQRSLTQKKHLECHTGPKESALNPATRSPSPNPDMDLDIPFKGHGPVKTSSPIEENLVVEQAREQNEEKDRAVSPILFDCQYDDEEAETGRVSCQKIQSNGHPTEKNKDFELESPPLQVMLSKPRVSGHKKEVERLCNKSQPAKEQTPKKPQNEVVAVVKEKTPKESQKSDLTDKRKTEKVEEKGHKEPSVRAVRQEPELPAPTQKSVSGPKKPSAEVPIRAGKDMASFLLKLREAGQSKPACQRKSLSPVKIPTPPPEPEDDFLILEDETPLWISIPTKNAASRKQRQKETSSTDKDSSKETPAETEQKQQESEQANEKLGSGTLNQKVKKTKGKEKKNKEVEPKNDAPGLPTPKDPPAVDLMEQGKPNKKKQQLKKVLSEESDGAQEQSEDMACRDKDKARSSLDVRKQPQKSPEKKKVKPLNKLKENAKKGKTKTLKENKKVNKPRQGSRDSEEPGAQSDQEVAHSEAEPVMGPADRNDELEEPLPMSDENLSNDEDNLWRRKRQQIKQWLMTSPEKTKVTDRQSTSKKTKQKKEPNTATASPVKAKKENLLKRGKKTETASSSSQKTTKAKAKKTKPSKNKNKEDSPVKKKATHKVFDEIEVEQVGEHERQDRIEEDGHELSSPFDCTRRNCSTGSQVFQKVYHHTPTQKKLNTPAPVTPQRPQEQLKAAEPWKRRRKAPGSWWLVDGPPVEVENISSQPQQQEPKSQRGKKKKSKQESKILETPKNSNVSVPSKPQGGPPVPQLNVKPSSAPKTVKRSLALFKGILTSNIETPTGESSKEVGQRNTHQVTATDPPIPEFRIKDVFSVDAGEPNSPPNQDATQDSRCQSEITVCSLKAHRSGPSSMIELQVYEEDGTSGVLSPKVRTALSASDLWGPPLKPLTIQLKDKVNLMEWFRSLWSTNADVSGDSEITPDQFDWYFYKGRAIGFLVDLDSGTICNGKILLGSFMKKPLWVDHSATSVFNLLTSSVCVTINGSESRFNPGQSFMVPCGNAYSIENVSSQPAVMCFTRILAESLE
ncbi:uncharacterized protein si:ch211-161h7.4 isoform X2 [Xyrichtys novacula]|uniref:Uncharacterized protein si:ch211-161h7.4 isoform X2 n=1 Tax=Xyrichtys novacula TaxID=13765 RepID=A0AAV1H7W9_XYRNO|nr:uncharacterized protein si:ch211-161h7.4 isoform X2 [Xyrichtys novacula]